MSSEDVQVEIFSNSMPSPLPRLLVGISTKLYFSHQRSVSYLQELYKALSSQRTETLRLFYIPTFLSLYTCAAILKDRTQWPIYLGGQDCHVASTGPHTGSISPTHLREAGCSLVELGHAERRREPFHESDQFVAQKVVAAIEAGLVPLVCIGEHERSKSGIASEGVGIALREVKSQVESVLEAMDSNERTQASPIIFAYEPVWAIGSTEAAGADHVVAVAKEIKRLIKQSRAERNVPPGDVRILYGGSAGPGIWEKFQGELDGLFLGRFAHDVKNVVEVVKEMLQQSNGK
jgi:triosephosphate isomerase (TIM)